MCKAEALKVPDVLTERWAVFVGAGQLVWGWAAAARAAPEGARYSTVGCFN